MWCCMDHRSRKNSQAEGGASKYGGCQTGLSGILYLGLLMDRYRFTTQNLSSLPCPPPPPPPKMIHQVKESVHVPVVANGDIRCEDDVLRVHTETGVDGVMSARGILDNPALYAGYSHTPIECVRDWISLSLGTGVTFTQFHSHLIHMLDKVTAKTEKRVFNTLSSTPAVLDYLQHMYGISSA